MRRMAVLVTALGCALAVGCPESHTTGDGGTGVLVAFTGSKCKKEQTAALYASLTRALVTGVDGSAYEGLQCVSWDLTSYGKFDLLNFASVCGADWVGSAAAADDGTVTLTLSNPSCQVAGCGSCIYDWSFTVDRPKAAGDIPLNVDVVVCDKPGEDSNNKSFALTIPATPAKGVTCRYADFGALQWQAFTLGTMGQLNMPCVDPADYPGDGGVPPPCDDGLACTPTAPGQYRDGAICLKTCTTDADCPLPDLVSCQAGVCWLKAQW